MPNCLRAPHGRLEVWQMIVEFRPNRYNRVSPTCEDRRADPDSEARAYKRRRCLNQCIQAEGQGETGGAGLRLKALERSQGIKTQLGCRRIRDTAGRGPTVSRLELTIFLRTSHVED